MEPLDYLRVYRRRWRLLAACVLVAGVAAWVATPAEPSTEAVSYTAAHTIIRDSQQPVPPPALPTVSLYVKTGEVPRRVAQRIDYEGEPAVLAARVSLGPDESVGTLEISATGADPEAAAALANAFAEETLGILGDQARDAQQTQIARVNEDVARLQADLAALEEEVREAERSGAPSSALTAQRDSRARQYGAALDLQEQVLAAPPPTAGYLTLQEALPELASVVDGGFSAPQSRPARAGLAAAVGLFLGLGAVLVAERLDTKVRTRQDAEEAFGLPVVAEVPLADLGGRHRILTDTEPLSATAEAYRTLRTALLLAHALPVGTGNHRRQPSPDAEPQVVLVTSPAPGDGKTTTVANLAAAYAETGRSVLVLGCDFRKPEIHKLFDVAERPGVSDVLTGDGKVSLRDVVRPTPVSGVFVAPSGDALANLGQVASGGPGLIRAARQLADVVLIDTAPMLATNEASELLAASDTVVLVCRTSRTSMDAAKKTRALLERLGSQVSGVTLIGSGDDHRGYGGYYSSSTVPPRRRAPIPLRRTVPSEEIVDRIQPWHGVDPSDPVPRPSRSTSDPSEPDPAEPTRPNRS